MDFNEKLKEIKYRIKEKQRLQELISREGQRLQELLVKKESLFDNFFADYHVQNKIYDAKIRAERALDSVDELIEQLESQLSEAKREYEALENERFKLIENYN